MAELFKNNISPALVRCIAGHLEKHLQQFHRASFEMEIIKDLEELELKARAQLIADHIHKVLPEDHVARYKILLAILRPMENIEGNPQSDEEGICGWGMMPLGFVVGQHGLEHFEESLLLLKKMTSRFTSEFDVRYFLLADQDRALRIMKSWVNDSNTHVRRLVSEGTRPRLPWAMKLPKLIADPSPVFPLLEALRDDKEEYVRRSVANHLNDIATDHPDLVAELAKKWMIEADKNRKKLVRHACRTLIKQGHRGALEVFGLRPPKLKLKKMEVQTPTVVFGGSLMFSAELLSTSKESQDLVVDYVVHFLKSSGKLSGKVFKWKKLTLKSDEALTLTKSHAIRPITTRRYYHGIQAVSLRINGEDFGFVEFNLDMTGDK